MPPKKSRLSLEHRLVTALLVVDQQQFICQANDAAEELLQHSERQLLGTPLERWIRDSEFSSPEAVQALLDDKQFNQRESKLLLLSGRVCLVDVSINRFKENEQFFLLIELNQVHPSLIITVDEKELGQHRQQRVLLRDLAHEIRNPLGGLRGAAQLLSRQVSSEQQAYTDIILREADRLGNLVERVLGPGKPEVKAEFNIHEVIEEVMHLVVLDKPEKITISRDYDPSLPEFAGYRSSLYQAVLNIVRNALQAVSISGDNIDVTTRAEHAVLFGNQYSMMALRIDISDNGPGVPEHLAENLFMPMTSGRIDGTGLGLSIASTAVEQQGGSIRWSREKQRTVFTIFLPFSKKSEESKNEL